jgi:predicted O-methyltransferase YrrM
MEAPMIFDRLETGGFRSRSDPGEPGTHKARVSVTDEEGKLLRWFAHGKRCLEIGTGLGVSTRWLALSALEVTTVDVDPWVHTEIFPAFHKDVKCLTDRDQVTGQFDLVFIDARHTLEDVHTDFQFACSKCPQGVILMHDAYDRAIWDYFVDWWVIPTQFGIGVKFVGWS